MQEMDRVNAEGAGKLSGANLSNGQYRAVLAAAVALLVAVMLAAICIGRYGVTPFNCVKILASNFFDVEPTWTKTMQSVVMVLRLPRVLTAALVGAGLAVSGAAYQSMFKNPMVSPDILGVSSGASIGACLSILLGMGAVVTQSWAFIGGMLAVLITAAVPRLMKNASPVLLVLAGIITGGLMSSVLGIIRYLAMSYTADETVLADMTYWTMGSFSKAGAAEILSVAPVTLVAGAVLVLIIIYSALASTVSSVLTASSNLLVQDIYKRAFKPDATDEQIVKYVRSTIVGMAVITVILVWNQPASMYQVLYLTGSAVAATIWPIAFGIYNSKVNRTAVLVAMLCSVGFGLVAYFTISSYAAPVVSALIGLVVISVGTKFSPDNSFSFDQLDEQVSAISNK